MRAVRMRADVASFDHPVVLLAYYETRLVPKRGAGQGGGGRKGDKRKRG